MKKIHNYDNKTKKDNKLFHLNKDVVWIIEITLLAFTLSFVLSMFSDKVVSGSTAIVSVIVLLVFIFLGIIFDMIGVAVTVADEKVFNSMASKKIRVNLKCRVFVTTSSGMYVEFFQVVQE